MARSSIGPAALALLLIVAVPQALGLGHVSTTTSGNPTKCMEIKLTIAAADSVRDLHFPRGTLDGTEALTVEVTKPGANPGDPPVTSTGWSVNVGDENVNVVKTTPAIGAGTWTFKICIPAAEDEKFGAAGTTLDVTNDGDNDLSTGNIGQIGSGAKAVVSLDPSEVPTLSEWGLIALGATLLVGGGLILRRGF